MNLVRNIVIDDGAKADNPLYQKEVIRVNGKEKDCKGLVYNLAIMNLNLVGKENNHDGFVVVRDGEKKSF